METEPTKSNITICSNMHCYNQAKVTDDPAHPPFCQSCKKEEKIQNELQDTQNESPS